MRRFSLSCYKRFRGLWKWDRTSQRYLALRLPSDRLSIESYVKAPYSVLHRRAGRLDPWIPKYLWMAKS